MGVKSSFRFLSTKRLIQFQELIKHMLVGEKRNNTLMKSAKTNMKQNSKAGKGGTFTAKKMSTLGDVREDDEQTSLRPMLKELQLTQSN